MEPKAVVLIVTVVPLTLIMGAEGLVPRMVMVLVPERVVPSGTAGVPPVNETVTVHVAGVSLAGKVFTVTEPVAVVPLIDTSAVELMSQLYPLIVSAAGVFDVLPLKK